MVQASSGVRPQAASRLLSVSGHKAKLGQVPSHVGYPSNSSRMVPGLTGDAGCLTEASYA
jgi:hypothetical protein